MELSLTNVTYRHHHHQPSPLSLLQHHRPLSNSISFHKTTPFLSLTPLRASSRNPNHKTPKPHITKLINPTSLSFLKSTFITGVTVTALFLSQFTVKPAIATPTSAPPPPAAVETSDSNSDQQQEEKDLEHHLNSHPKDTKALKSLMEFKINSGNVHEAINLLNQLIDLEPEDSEWQLLKNHLLSYAGDNASAKLGFEEVLSKDPLRVEAYHGLVMAASAKGSAIELAEVENKIMEGMKICKKNDELRDFKILLAQIRVVQGDYEDALKIYEELCKEEPGDFRPYVCKGIVYTYLGKIDEAEKNFERYRNLKSKSTV